MIDPDGAPPRRIGGATGLRLSPAGRAWSGMGKAAPGVLGPGGAARTPRSRARAAPLDGVLNRP
jgi:hypothetical protein